MFLAYDTTHRNTVISWCFPNQEVQTRTWEKVKATEVLMPALAEICGQKPLTALGVITGPGSFTGIRVGLAAAQGLAAARSLPVFGFTRHQLAAPHVGDGLLVMAVVRGGAVCVPVKGGKIAGEIGVRSFEALAQAPDLVSLEPHQDLAARVVPLCLTELCLAHLAAQPNPEDFPPTPCYVRPADAVAGKSLVSRLLAQSAGQG